MKINIKILLFGNVFKNIFRNSSYANADDAITRIAFVYACGYIKIFNFVFNFCDAHALMAQCLYYKIPRSLNTSIGKARSQTGEQLGSIFKSQSTHFSEK